MSRSLVIWALRLGLTGIGGGGMFGGSSERSERWRAFSSSSSVVMVVVWDGVGRDDGWLMALEAGSMYRLY